MFEYSGGLWWRSGPPIWTALTAALGGVVVERIEGPDALALPEAGGESDATSEAHVFATGDEGMGSLVARLQYDLPRQTAADDLADLEAVLVTLHLLLVVTADLLG